MQFLGFANFHLKWIPFFELHASILRDLIYRSPLDDKFPKNSYTSHHNNAFQHLKTAVTSKPILQRYNHNKRCYLKTNFSAKGLGYAICQPDDSPDSLAAMQLEERGGKC